MTVVSYEPTSTMRAARDRYFAVNNFGADGGYNDKWTNFELGSMPFPFPNTAARVRALQYHDMHHILTDYNTDFVGELEISAWEVGAGCKDFAAAWILNLAGIGAWIVAPRRVFAAWVRGRRSESLYGLPLDPLLESTVAQARERMRVPVEAPAPTLGDRLTFVAAAATGTVLGLALFATLLPLVPFGLVARKFVKAPPKTTAT
ncbi:MAG: hypothetical protein U0269_21115 [Polyangiales bacterium]